jgi:ribonuclease HI
MNRPTVIVYCDGACAPNPGVGGWAAILRSPAHPGAERELSGAEAASTNNRMEMTAAVMALRALLRPCAVRLTTDSAYLKKAFTEGWLAKWQRNGWRTVGRQPVANEDLWRELLALTAKHEVSWQWVRGHATDELNNRCDALAVRAREALAQELSRKRRP